MNLETIPAKDRLDLISVFCERIRLEDRLEVAAVTELPLGISLLVSIAASSPLCWWTLKDGKPSVLYGASPLPDRGPDWAAVWLLGTEDIEQNPKTFQREAVKMLKEMRNHYPNLTNCADCRNPVHLQWIDRLGFKFTRYHPSFGRFGLPFVEFVLT